MRATSHLGARLAAATGFVLAVVGDPLGGLCFAALCALSLRLEHRS